MALGARRLRGQICEVLPGELVTPHNVRAPRIRTIRRPVGERGFPHALRPAGCGKPRPPGCWGSQRSRGSPPMTESSIAGCGRHSRKSVTGGSVPNPLGTSRRDSFPSIRNPRSNHLQNHARRRSAGRFRTHSSRESFAALNVHRLFASRQSTEWPHFGSVESPISPSDGAAEPGLIRGQN